MASLLNKVLLTTWASSRGAALLPRGAQRGYRRHPTHDIGRFQFMLRKLQGKGRKAKAKPDPIWTSPSALLHDTLNVSLSGHDVVLVEHFARYAHLLCNRLGVSVVESYALPTRTLDVLLQEQGTKMVAEASLSTHSRVIQVAKLSSTLAPVLLEVLQLNQPEGVAIDVSQHTEEDYRQRLKQRPELEQLQAQVKGRREE